jgi:hypothetical protein
MDDEAVQAAMEHNPEVTVRGYRTFWARCTCGWLGPERNRSSAADDDCHAHLQAVLPDDAPGSIYR